MSIAKKESFGQFGLIFYYYSIDKSYALCYTFRREGVASAKGAVSQHPDRAVWLALNRETHVLRVLYMIPFGIAFGLYLFF